MVKELWSVRRVFGQKQKEPLADMGVGEESQDTGKSSCTHPVGKLVWLPWKPAWPESKRWGAAGAQDISDSRLAAAGGTPSERASESRGGTRGK